MKSSRANFRYKLLIISIFKEHFYILMGQQCYFIINYDEFFSSVYIKIYETELNSSKSSNVSVIEIRSDMLLFCCPSTALAKLNISSK